MPGASAVPCFAEIPFRKPLPQRCWAQSYCQTEHNCERTTERTRPPMKSARISLWRQIEGGIIISKHHQFINIIPSFSSVLLLLMWFEFSFMYDNFYIWIDYSTEVSMVGSPRSLRCHQSDTGLSHGHSHSHWWTLNSRLQYVEETHTETWRACERASWLWFLSLHAPNYINPNQFMNVFMNV